jgi:hypothetical protein
VPARSVGCVLLRLDAEQLVHHVEIGKAGGVRGVVEIQPIGHGDHGQAGVRGQLDLGVRTVHAAGMPNDAVAVLPAHIPAKVENAWKGWAGV